MVRFAVLGGLITAEAIEQDVPDNLPSIERAFSNQELDLFDDSNSRVILIKTVDTSPSVPTSTGRSQPSNFLFIELIRQFYQIRLINSKVKLMLHNNYIDIENLTTFNISDGFILYEKISNK